MRKTRVILISLLLYGQLGTDLIVHTLAHAIEVSLHNAVVEVLKQFTECKTITINKKSFQKKKQKQCNGNHFLDVSSSSLMRIWNASTFNEWMSFFNRIRPDPGFVSPVRSDPIQLLSVRSDPIRSGPIRSDPGFVNGRKDSSMQHILVHDNLVVFWIFI